MSSNSKAGGTVFLTFSDRAQFQIPVRARHLGQFTQRAHVVEPGPQVQGVARGGCFHALVSNIVGGAFIFAHVAGFVAQRLRR
jgi:hypothetical protein